MNLILVAFIFFNIGGYTQGLQSVSIRQIKIEIEVSDSLKRDSLMLRYVPSNFVGLKPEWTEEKLKVENQSVKWEIDADRPILLGIESLKLFCVAEPDDDIKIKIDKDGGDFKYSGKGAEKFRLLDDLKISIKEIKIPQNPTHLTVTSYNDYQEWDNYLNQQSELVLSILNRYKGRISAFAYDHIKKMYLTEIEWSRSFKFNMLAGNHIKFGLDKEGLKRIFDSFSNSPETQWLLTKVEANGGLNYYYLYICLLAQRRANFELISTDANQGYRRMLCYNLAQEVFKGEALENFLVFFIVQQCMKEAGFLVPEVETILEDYYKKPHPAEYVDYIKKQEFICRTQYARNGKIMRINFAAPTADGRMFYKNETRGKIVLINFWNSGCKDCIDFSKSMDKISRTFKDNKDVVFLNVSNDLDSVAWRRSAKTKKYGVKGGIDLYSSAAERTSFLMNVFAMSYLPSPQFFLWDHTSRIVHNPLPDPRKDNGDGLIRIINEQLALKKEHDLKNFDGPYVFHDQEPVSYAIYKGKIKKEKLTPKAVIKTSNEDPANIFEISLKEKLDAEPSIYLQPEKLFVLSDIEGQFVTFKKLLQSNKIIDDKYNWIFGKGHLVFAGDMFDRGLEVTECLWLIYSLEAKAKAVGGYVHFILGNHEIMNLQGNHRYVLDKYKENADLLGKTLTQLYDKDTELGRWLRTKNIMEKIGDVLYLHAGISPEINRLSLSITGINDLVRPYFGGDLDSSNNNLLMLFSTEKGEKYYISPLWSRGYYAAKPNQRINIEQLDSTLAKFDVNRIVTGHTIVGDTISVHYNGKVINTDTPHARGKSEGLMIEGQNYYRVNSEGEKKRLFIQDSSPKRL